jgi:hypothetical protein
MKPHPALSLPGRLGYAAWTSVRDPRMNTARPTKICPVPSDATGERKMSTLATPESSSAQPVMPTSPLTVMLLPGVSTTPKGGAGAVIVTASAVDGLNCPVAVLWPKATIEYGPGGTTVVDASENPELLNREPWAAATSGREMP